MARQAPSRKGGQSAAAPTPAASVARPSALVDTRIIYCGDCLDQLSSEPRPSGSGFLPQTCVDRGYLWHRFPTGDCNSNRNYEVFWGDRTEPQPSRSGFLAAFEDRHASTQAYIDYMRPRCVELARVLKKTGSFYYHCDWHAGQRVRLTFAKARQEVELQLAPLSGTRRSRSSGGKG